jgi:hypothetical protein
MGRGERGNDEEKKKKAQNERVRSHDSLVGRK